MKEHYDLTEQEKEDGVVEKSWDGVTFEVTFYGKSGLPDTLAVSVNDLVTIKDILKRNRRKIVEIKKNIRKYY